MIIKNWAHTHNFCDVAHLIAHHDGKERYTHLIMTPKNATYISPEYSSPYINIITEFVKKPLHSTMTGFPPSYNFFQPPPIGHPLPPST